MFAAKARTGHPSALDDVFSKFMGNSEAYHLFTDVRMPTCDYVLCFNWVGMPFTQVLLPYLNGANPQELPTFYDVFRARYTGTTVVKKSKNGLFMVGTYLFLPG